MATTLLSAAARSMTEPSSRANRAFASLPTAFTNVSSLERWLSLAAGGLLAVRGYTGRGPSLCSSLLSGYLIYRGVTGNCPFYQLAGVSTSDTTAEHASIAAGHGTRVDAEVVVDRPAGEVYRFWRDLENLARFMTHLLDVDTTTDGKSHWVARGPLGLRMEWDAELVTDQPNEVISWRSLPGSDVDTAGSVHFEDLGNDRTKVRVELKYDPPAGKVGTAIAKLVGRSPDRQVRADLQRFKEVIEGTLRVIG
jgi:uncharacterized membrane protein